MCAHERIRQDISWISCDYDTDAPHFVGLTMLWMRQEKTSVMLRPTTVTDLVYDIFSCYFRSGSTNKVNGLLFSFLTTLYMFFSRNKIRSGGVVRSIKIRLSQTQETSKFQPTSQLRRITFDIKFSSSFFSLSFLYEMSELVGNCCSCLCAIFLPSAGPLLSIVRFR